jgi:hypothetical protein
MVSSADHSHPTSHVMQQGRKTYAPLRFGLQSARAGSNPAWRLCFLR